ncbi:hypothetical protein [Ketobacter sp.]|uniref:hypothetical protein n=1 Tax=Ketobacter sp. TaxID=2083498 RepID=UPI0025BCEA29|nr:hypothetical protein [Ketobacter sp.]
MGTVIGMGMGLAGCNPPLDIAPLPQPAFDDTTLARMHNSQAINLHDILAQNQLLATPAETTISRSPYQPLTLMNFAECWQDTHCRYSITETGIPLQAFPANEVVYAWWQSRLTEPDQAAVCGLRFLEDDSAQYELASFSNRTELDSTPGFQLTHYQQCGSCSTLQDLAVYGSLDLTVMAKTCSKQQGFTAKQRCMEDIGFTSACAESWAFNAQQTTQSCFVRCVQEYGLIPLILGTESSPNTNGGQLNQCLLCDEMMAGPGFQYAAGRTRRNSGITSEIDRPEDQVYEVEHHYFD